MGRIHAPFMPRKFLDANETNTLQEGVQGWAFPPAPLPIGERAVYFFVISN